MCPSPDHASRDHEKLKILVVDDEPTLRLGFAYALSNAFTLVETASNGRQALERIAERQFDVMILDLRMPEMDGIGVLDALRSQGNPMAVVLCSAAISPEVTLRAIRHGVVDFLLKPVRPVDLRQVVEFVLRPGKSAFARALIEVRKRRFSDAVTLLEKDGNSQLRTTCWLKILKGILAYEEISTLERTVQSSLPVIAFNSSTLS
jgi:CheY-like chemotaxis protein